MTNPAHTQTMRALIVDDDPRWRAIVAEIVVGLGWNIAASAAPPDDLTGFNIAVLDMSLDPTEPGSRDGLKLMERLTALGTPCVLLSGISMAELIGVAEHHANVLGYLTKDAFRRDKLVELLQQAPTTQLQRQPEILIIEDDAGWRAIYQDLLSDRGYRLQTAASYAEARAGAGDCRSAPAEFGRTAR
jgi:CheY-like chemotaxis protein